MGYRSCLGLLNLTKQYGTVRVEAACARAVALHAPHRSTVASILKRGLDSQPLDGVTADDEPHLAPLAHDNLRGADYYR